MFAQTLMQGKTQTLMIGSNVPLKTLFHPSYLYGLYQFFPWLLFNRPGVAGAVLQTATIIIHKLTHPFLKLSSKHFKQ